LWEKTRVDLSQNQYDRTYVDFAKRMSATFNPALHPFNCDFGRLQPELASGGLCSVESYSFSRIEREHLTFAAKLEIGVRSQESGEKRKKEEGRSQKKCFYKYEMLPIEQSYDRLKLFRRRNRCQSLIKFAVFVSLSVLGGYATDINSGCTGIIVDC